jgi:4-hydroxy-tetrahydrodipicolinate synthase
VIRRCGSSLEVYSGDDSLTLPVIAVGGRGVISVVANVLPKQSAEAVDAALRNDWETARRLHYRMLPLIRALFLETNPIPIKAAASMMGFCRDELRLPLLPMTDGPRETLRALLRESGALA